MEQKNSQFDDLIEVVNKGYGHDGAIRKQVSAAVVDDFLSKFLVEEVTDAIGLADTPVLQAACMHNYCAMAIADLSRVKDSLRERVLLGMIKTLLVHLTDICETLIRYNKTVLEFPNIAYIRAWLNVQFGRYSKCEDYVLDAFSASDIEDICGAYLEPLLQDDMFYDGQPVAQFWGCVCTDTPLNQKMADQWSEVLEFLALTEIQVDAKIKLLVTPVETEETKETLTP